MFEVFEAELRLFETQFSHRSWWPQLKATLKAMQSEVEELRREILERLDDLEDRLHQQERPYDSYE
jgi:TolA-binding protein